MQLKSIYIYMSNMGLILTENSVKTSVTESHSIIEAFVDDESEDRFVSAAGSS